MPADFSNYIDLRSFDVSPTEIYLDAIEYARLVLPEFQLRQGTPEDAIMQAASYVSALNIGAINRLPDRLMSGILGMMGVEIDDGTQAVVDVVFTAINYEGTSIPQGTLLRYEYEILGERLSIYFETTEEAVIPPVAFTGTEPLPTITVECRCIDVGEIPTIGTGVELSIDTPTSDILSAVMDAMVSNGTNPENSDQYLDRCIKYLSSLSSSLAKATQVDAYVLSNFQSTVSRCKTYDLTNYSSGMQLTDPDEVGYITVVTYGYGQQLTEDQKTDVRLGIEDRAVAGLEVAVVPANEVQISMSASIGYSSKYDELVTEDNIKSALSRYFSPLYYSFTDKIRRSEFFSVIMSVPGVLYAESLILAIEAGDASINGDGDVEFDLKGTLPFIDTDEIVLTLTAVE